MLPHNFVWEGHVLLVSSAGHKRICSAKLSTSCTEHDTLDTKMREQIVERIQELLSKVCRPDRATVLKSTRMELGESYIPEVIQIDKPKSE
jgi:hypothetical protein